MVHFGFLLWCRWYIKFSLKNNEIDDDFYYKENR